MQLQQQEEWIKYAFSEMELAEIAAEMARKVSELRAAEDRKKAIVSQIKSEIDAISAEVSNKADLLNNGYEMRRMKCDVVPDYQRRRWDIYRPDTNELVRSRPMTPNELQMRIDDEVGV